MLLVDKERFSVVVPPAGALPDERARETWAKDAWAGSRSSAEKTTHLRIWHVVMLVTTILSLCA